MKTILKVLKIMIFVGCIIAAGWLVKEIVVWLFTDPITNPKTSVDSMIDLLK